MKILLDTHVLLWWLADDPLLSRKARSLIIDKKNIVFISAATTWEMMIKKALGKLEAPDDIVEMIKDNQFKDLPITLAHTVAIRDLPKHHHDPFDRMLVAQAKSESLTLITADEKLTAYDVNHLKV